MSATTERQRWNDWTATVKDYKIRWWTPHTGWGGIAIHYWHPQS